MTTRRKNTKPAPKAKAKAAKNASAAKRRPRQKDKHKVSRGQRKLVQMAPRPVGRPPLLTRELIEEFRQLLPKVFYIEMVATALGISRETWRVWVRRGRAQCDRLATYPAAEPLEAETLYLEFFAAYKSGIAQGGVQAMLRINEAAQGQWQANAWLMERRFPQLWGQRSRVEVTGAKGAELPAPVIYLPHNGRDPMPGAGKPVQGCGRNGTAAGGVNGSVPAAPNGQGAQ